MKNKMGKLLTCGIDIGTTTLSAVVCDIISGKQIKSYTLEHNAFIESNIAFERAQDADHIISLATELLDSIIDTYPEISAIGVTGQMHGILYTDKEGRAASPLYTWQDGRGNETMGAVSYAEHMAQLSDSFCASGFGLVTHYYNLKNSLVPREAVAITSIMDYLIMRLTGNTFPICHPSVAASFGLYDIKGKCFMPDALEKLGIDVSLLPHIITEDKPVGKYRGIDITLSLGDNQASVFGSVIDEENTLLLNYGTGSQISVISDEREIDSPLEVRPYIVGKNLICGCALCGGYAYALLEGFFRSYAVALGVDENQYSVMDELAERALYSARNDTPKLSPLFKGTRQNPSLRGSITGLSADNFNAGNFILATVEGMVDELYSMYEGLDVMKRSVLVASGNAVKKNSVLQAVLEKRFDMGLMILENREEAAMGAAMYAAVCVGVGFSDVKGCISYKNRFDFE